MSNTKYVHYIKFENNNVLHLKRPLDDGEQEYDDGTLDVCKTGFANLATLSDKMEIYDMEDLEQLIENPKEDECDEDVDNYNYVYLSYNMPHYIGMSKVASTVANAVRSMGKKIKLTVTNESKTDFEILGDVLMDIEKRRLITKKSYDTHHECLEWERNRYPVDGDERGVYDKE